MNSIIDHISNLFKKENVKLRDFAEVIHLQRTWHFDLDKNDLGELANLTDLKHDKYDCKVYLQQY